MHATNPAIIFTQRFDAIGIRYMITGSVAATLYGEPRLTNDVDIVAVILDAHLAPLANAFMQMDWSKKLSAKTVGNTDKRPFPFFSKIKA